MCRWAERGGVEDRALALDPLLYGVDPTRVRSMMG